jgi:GT2 family glycosyltransferase
VVFQNIQMIPPTVHVGIVTYNSLNDLPRCLDALSAQSYSHITVTILDNASSDGTQAWIAAHARHARCIMRVSNVGFGQGHNEIIQQTKLGLDDAYLPLNPDAILTPHYIEAALPVLQRSGVGWVIGKLLQSGPGGEPTAILYSAGHAMQRDGYTINIGCGMRDTGQYETEREVFGASGAAPLISGRLIRDLVWNNALYDPDLFLYAEDTDMDWRARLQGWQCWYVPGAIAYHRGSQPGEALRAHAIANRMLSVIKNAFLVDLLIFNLPLIVLHCLLRLILTPRTGWRMTAQVLRLSPRMIRKRRDPRVTRQNMLHWFLWSALQKSEQPLSWSARLRARLNRESAS